MTNEELLLEFSNLLQGQFQPIKEQLNGLERRVGRLEKEIQSLRNEFTGLKSKFSGLDLRLSRVEITLENQVIPMLRELSACSSDTYERYSKGAAKIDAMEQDVTILKNVVAVHSQKLEQLS